jgi:hypothetical protein
VGVVESSQDQKLATSALPPTTVFEITSAKSVHYVDQLQKIVPIANALASDTGANV